MKLLKTKDKKKKKTNLKTNKDDLLPVEKNDPNFCRFSSETVMTRESGTIFFVIVQCSHNVLQKHLSVTEQGVARGSFGAVVLFFILTMVVFM